MYSFSVETRKAFYKQMLKEIDNILTGQRMIRDGYTGYGLCRMTNSCTTLQLILKDEGKEFSHYAEVTPVYYDAYSDRFESFPELWEQFSEPFKNNINSYLGYTDVSGWEGRKKIALNALNLLS